MPVPSSRPRAGRIRSQVGSKGRAGSANVRLRKLHNDSACCLLRSTLCVAVVGPGQRPLSRVLNVRVGSRSDRRRKGAYRPRLCENASAKRATLKSISQFALYSTIDPSGIPKRPPKTRSFRVFTQPRPVADAYDSGWKYRKADCRFLSGRVGDGNSPACPPNSISKLSTWREAYDATWKR